MRRLFGALIWWAIADRVITHLDSRIKEAEDYTTSEAMRAWRREGEIMRDAHDHTCEYTRNLSDEILAIRKDVLKLQVAGRKRAA